MFLSEREAASGEIQITRRAELFHDAPHRVNFIRHQRLRGKLLRNRRGIDLREAARLKLLSILRKELAQPLEAFDHDAIGARRAAATQQLEAVRYDHERIPVVAPGVEQGVLHLSTGTGDELSVAIMPRPVAEERDGKLPHAIDEARLQKQVLRIHAALMAEVAGVVAGVEGDAVACEGGSVAKSCA